jgi:Fe-S-cluster containining protein
MNKNINQVAREIKQIYKETDVKMKDIQNVCQKGCSYCCHQTIPVHSAEELPIMKYINTNFEKDLIEDIKKNLINWFEYFDKNTPNEKILDEQDILVFSEKHVKDFIACPFLIDDECTIYQSRPLVCRTFSVNDTSDLCQDKPNRMGDIKGYDLQKKKFEQIVKVADFVGTRLLPYAVAEQFGIKKQLKPIGTNVINTLNKQNS